MKIAVLGATGATGLEFVKQAVEDHDVSAIVRNPTKLTFQNEKLKVISGDIFCEKSLTTCFQKVETVVSCLGFPRAKSVTGYSESMRSITSAMRANNITRLVVITAFYTDTSSTVGQGCFVNWFLVPFLRQILNDMRRMEIYLEENCTDINFTFVRPPGLTNDKLAGKPLKSTINGYYVPKGAGRIPRANVAKFMLDCVPNKELYKKGVAIAL